MNVEVTTVVGMIVELYVVLVYVSAALLWSFFLIWTAATLLYTSLFVGSVRCV